MLASDKLLIINEFLKKPAGFADFSVNIGKILDLFGLFFY